MGITGSTKWIKIEIANFKGIRPENNKYKIKPNNYLMNEFDFFLKIEEFYPGHGYKYKELHLIGNENETEML